MHLTRMQNLPPLYMTCVNISLVTSCKTNIPIESSLKCLWCHKFDSSMCKKEIKDIDKTKIIKAWDKLKFVYLSISTSFANPNTFFVLL